LCWISISIFYNFNFYSKMITTTKTNIFSNASRGIANGVNICRKAVEGTLGGRGKNAIIKQEFYPFYLQTKDAFSIIQAIKCEDPLESLAVDMMKDATDSMNKRSKDGRTTMCILTDEILQGVQNCQDKNIDWEKELTELLPFIEQKIDEQTRPITVDEVEAVARTASDSVRLGKLIGDVYKKQGAECIINHIESSGTFDDEVIYTNGVHFTNTGFVAPAFVHDEQAVKEGRREVKAIYEKPTILVTKNKINETDITPLIEKMVATGKKDLIIFASDMDNEMVRKLIATHKAKVLNICVIKAPIIFKDMVFEDFAKATGATIIEDATGKTFKNLTFDDLGTCDRIEIEKEEIVLNPSIDLTEHIADLKAKGDEDSLRRVFWLTTKTAKIKLGAVNEGELSLLRLKALDAIHSSQLALQYGIVAGGGICLSNIIPMLPQKAGLTTLMKKVLDAPFQQIKLNAGLDKFIGFTSMSEGINVKTGKVVDMFDEGIVDSAIVQKNAIKNAIHIALRAITTNTFIDLPKRTTEDLQLEILGRQRMNF
jgi:chaperonin GroEL